MSKDAGDILEAAIFNATGSQGVLEMIIDVTNDQDTDHLCPVRHQSKENQRKLIIVGGSPRHRLPRPRRRRRHLRNCQRDGNGSSD